MTSWLKRVPMWLLFTAVAFFALRYIEQRGYERRDAEAVAEQARFADQYATELRANLQDAHMREQQYRQQLQHLNEQTQQRASALSAHLKTQEQHLETRHASSPEPRTPPQPQAEAGDQDRPLLGAAVLDAYTARLLNNARANANSQDGSAAPGVDETGRPTTITGADFALNDLEVVRLYHELATRHRGLVGWVQKQCVDPANLDKSVMTK